MPINRHLTLHSNNLFVELLIIFSNLPQLSWDLFGQYFEAQSIVNQSFACRKLLRI
jgi:hypothetical protein